MANFAANPRQRCGNPPRCVAGLTVAFIRCLTWPADLRIVIAKPGLDGHDRGAKIIARALRDAGMEVVYTGLHQTPEQIVQTVLQEDADAVGLSVLSGAHMTLFRQVLELLRREGLSDVVVFGGGIVPRAGHRPSSSRPGWPRSSPPAPRIDEIVGWVRANVGTQHRRESSRSDRLSRQPASADLGFGGARTGRAPGVPSLRNGRISVDLFEYQAKQLFDSYGVPVSLGEVATTPEQARGDRRATRWRHRRQGAGEGRRPRQGRRREGGQDARRTPKPPPSRSSAWTSRATPCTGYSSTRAPRSNRSTTSPSCSTAPTARSWRWPPTRAAWRSSSSPSSGPRRWPRCRSTRWPAWTRRRHATS